MSDNDTHLNPSDIVKANQKSTNTIFNNVDEQHIAQHTLWRTPMTPYQCDCVHNRVRKIFNENICQLYHSLAYKETWYENIRQFIAFHNDIQVSINTNGLSDQEIVEVNDHGFTLFVGDNCANVHEDEFDGLTDLSIDEWERLDDIIMYYYLKDINGG
jgi:hypothetical protein